MDQFSTSDGSAPFLEPETDQIEPEIPEPSQDQDQDLKSQAGCSDVILSRICVFFLGLSAFPVTETLLLQCNLFTDCFDFGASYYALALLFLFLPGIGQDLDLDIYSSFLIITMNLDLDLGCSSESFFLLFLNMVILFFHHFALDSFQSFNIYRIGKIRIVPNHHSYSRQN